MVNKVLTLTAFLALTLTVIVSFPTGIKINANNVYIGSMDGKSFFAQMAPPMTWLEAKESCEESGMRLATITSIEQRSLLRRAHNNVTFEGFLWTSGRDALNPTQMIWDYTGVTLNKTVTIPYGNNSKMLSCLTFHSLNDTEFRFDAELCTNKFGAICEINHG